MIKLNTDKINDIENVLKLVYKKILKNPYIHVVMIIVGIFLLSYYGYNYEPLKIEIPETKYVKQRNLYIIDSGHGHNDKNDCAWKSVKHDGKCFYEYEFNKKVADYLCDMLNNADIYYLRTDTLSDKRDLSITERVEFINKIKRHLDKKQIIGNTHTVVLFSIHGNAARNIDANGLEVFTSIEKCKQYKGKEHCEKNMHILATLLADNLKATFPEKPFRSTSETEYKQTSMAPQGEITLLDETECYGVLSENGFYTNPKERNEMESSQYQIKVAAAHYKTICMLERITP